MGLLKKNQKGFTLVEVMITVGIMGVMAVFFYKYFNDQMKQQRTVLTKMEESNLINEIRVLLMNVDNCTESLKDQKLSLDEKRAASSSDKILFLTKVFTLVEKDKEPEVSVVEKYQKWIDKEQEIRFGQGKLKIENYSFNFSKEAYENLKKHKRGDIELVVTLDRGKAVFGNDKMPYIVPLEVEVDKDEKIISCSSMGLPAGGEASLVVVDANINPALKDKTGEQACRSKNLSCAYVQSTNYLRESSGGIDTGIFAHSCLSSYNQKLQGIKNGGGISNLHSCDAKLGVHDTFILPMGGGEMVCSGTFVAICN